MIFEMPHRDPRRGQRRRDSLHRSPGEPPPSATGEAFLRAAARSFPVCTASDEFYFFPQVAAQRPDWSSWDDFSVEGAGEFADRLRGWEKEILAWGDAFRGDEERIDGNLLLHALRTLREQLVKVQPQRQQPTFHLTVLCTGLAEALESTDREAWKGRISGIPAFLERATGCLGEIPSAFGDMGLEMAARVGRWLGDLERKGYDTGPAPEALLRFEASLRALSCRGSFALSGETLDRVLRNHMACGMGVEGVSRVISEEIGRMEEILRGEASRLAPGLSWEEAAQGLPRAASSSGDVVKLYRDEVKRLEEHCRSLGILPSPAARPGALDVRPLPSHLSAIRASDAYSSKPGHPPRGGTFFIFRGEGERSPEYRMTTAHETWPGHHLLDCSRWGLSRPLRRSLERPLFYEGWACLAEEIMARTDYFTGDWDAFILAKRRLRRAVRGKVDLALQSGRMGEEESAAELERADFRREEALTAVRKYALRPGYQVCYTMGLERFLALLDGYGAGDLGSFVGAVMSGGEVGFEDLERSLRHRKKK